MEKSSTNKNQQSTTVPQQCKVCGASAKYSYYGAVSCHPCKMFFKRNAEEEQKLLKCNFDGHCEINVNNRHICSYCRLMKCFKSGMQTELIRCSLGESNKTNRKKTAMVHPNETTSRALVGLNEPEQFPTLNLLQSDLSTLSVDQWNLLSNLSRCYDAHSGLSSGEHFMHQQNMLPHKLRFKTASVMELLQSIMDGSQSLYKNNRDFLSLSPDDRSILLHNTIEYTAVLSTNFILYEVRVSDCPAYYETLAIITNPSVISAAKHLVTRFDFDMIIMKLFLGILSFSTTNYTVYSNTPPVNLSNMKQILDIQNTYIELTWRYLLYKYNFKQAVKCFSNLIRCLFAVNDAMVKVEDIQWYSDTIDSLTEQTEQTLFLNS